MYLTSENTTRRMREGERERGRKSWVGSWTALSKSCIKYGCCAWEIATDGGRVGNCYGNSAPMSTTLVTSHHIIKRESGCRPPHPCCLPRLLSIFNSSAALWGFLHIYRAEREKTTHVTSCRESWWCRKRGAKERNGDTYKPQMCVCFHMSGFCCGGNGSIWSLTHVKLKPFKPLNLHTHTHTHTHTPSASFGKHSTAA